MRLRVEPRASRSATSRERSAARAAKRLPRLAHEPGHECLYGAAEVIAIEIGAGQDEGHLVFVFGIGLFEISSDGVQIGDGLRGRDSRLQMSRRHHEVLFISDIENVPVSELLIVHDRRPEIGKEEQQGSLERRRRHAEDGEGMLVYLDHMANHAGIVLKVGVPISVTEHQIGSAVRAVLIGVVKEAAKVRLNSQRVEVIPTYLVAHNLRGIPARIQAHRNDVEESNRVEAVVAISQVKIIGIRRACILVGAVLDAVEAFGLRHIQRAQDQTIHHSEDHGVCANGQGQGQDCGEGESGRFAQLA